VKKIDNSNIVSGTININIENKKITYKVDSSVYTTNISLITQQDNIKSNEPYTVSITVANISVYDIKGATPFVYTERNSKLLGENTEICEKFIFKTGEKSLPEIYALNNIGKKELSKVINPWVDGGINESVVNLKNALIGDNINLSAYYFELTVSYNYGFADSFTDAKIQLPVLMQKQILSDFSPDDLANSIKMWFDNTLPVIDKSSLNFSVRIYRDDKIVIYVDKLNVGYREA
jgi:hypothetical protein